MEYKIINLLKNSRRARISAFLLGNLCVFTRTRVKRVVTLAPKFVIESFQSVAASPVFDSNQISRVPNQNSAIPYLINHIIKL